MVLEELQYSIGRTLSDVSNVFNDIDNTLFTNKIKVPKRADELTALEFQRLQLIPKEIINLQKDAQEAAMRGDPQGVLKANICIMQLQDERERILFTRPAALPLLLGSLKDAVAGFSTGVEPRIERIMDDADAALKNGSALIRVRRAAPRDLSNFSDEEHHYLGDLRVQADNAWTSIVAKRAESDRLKASGAKDPQTLAHIEQLELEIEALTQQRNAANAAIDDLFYTEPGVITRTISDVDQSIRQFTPGVTSILADTDEVIKQAACMIQTKRIVPRKLPELGDDELAYVNGIWDKNMEIMGRRLDIKDELAKLKASGAHDPQTQNKIDQLTAEDYVLMQEWDANDAEAQRVLMLQPGVIPGTIASIGHLVREVTPPVTGAIEGIDSLLTIKRTAPRDESELNDEEQKYLAALRKQDKELNDQIKAKQDEIDRLKKSGANDQQTKDQIDSLTWELGNIKKAWENNYREIVRLLYTQPGVVPETIYGLNLSLRRFNMVEQPKIESIMDSVDDTADETAKVMAQVRGLFMVKTLVPVPDTDLLPGDKERLDRLQDELHRIDANLERQKGIFATVPVAGKSPVAPIQPLPGIAGKRTVLADGGIPMGPNVIGMGTAASGFRRSDMLLDNQNAYLKQLDREKLKVGQQIGRIKFREVDKPGVVPQIMDNANGSMEHVRSVLKNVDDVVGKATGMVNQYGLLIKIGLAIAAIGFVVTMILIPVLLLRMILFGL